MGVVGSPPDPHSRFSFVVFGSFLRVQSSFFFMPFTSFFYFTLGFFYFLSDFLSFLFVSRLFITIQFLNSYFPILFSPPFVNRWRLLGAFDRALDPLSDQERWIGSLLLRHAQLLQFNAHEISELQMDRPGCIDGIKSKSLGAAIFPMVRSV